MPALPKSTAASFAPLSRPFFANSASSAAVPSAFTGGYARCCSHCLIGAASCASLYACGRPSRTKKTVGYPLTSSRVASASASVPSTLASGSLSPSSRATRSSLGSSSRL